MRQEIIQDDATGDFYTFQRWGRQGTVGQQNLDGPVADVEVAKHIFMGKFKDKMVVGWVGRMLPDDKTYVEAATKAGVRLTPFDSSATCVAVRCTGSGFCSL